MDCSSADSSVHRVLQARILEWVAILFVEGIIPKPGIKPESPALQADSLTSMPSHKLELSIFYLCSSWQLHKVWYYWLFTYNQCKTREVTWIAQCCTASKTTKPRCESSITWVFCYIKVSKVAPFSSNWLSPGVCSKSSPMSQWCHPTISSSVAPFFSCLQSFSASESFPMSQLFTSGTGASVSTSVLPVNI